MATSFTYPIEIIDGHAIIKSENQCILIDTGTTSSFTEEKTLSLLGKNFTNLTPLSTLGMNLDNHIQCHVSTLLGLDILSNYQVIFDYKNKTVTFNESPVAINGEKIQFFSIEGIPAFSMTIDGQERKMLLDTGAPFAYIKPEHTNNHKCVEEKQDFNPNFGIFTSKFYKINSEVANKKFSISYGAAIEVLNIFFTTANCDGIIGLDLCNNFAVSIDFKNYELTLQPY